MPPVHSPVQPLTLRGVCYDPPLFCAPMAGITHSAFRRLLSDFGGYGALYTEMLSAKMVVHEDPETSPWLKRRPQEKRVIYQLLVTEATRLPATLARLAPASLVLPRGILTIIVRMVVPIPAFLLDLFFVLNIALSVAVLMAAMNAMKPLDFSSFPTVLLFATLLRLATTVEGVYVPQFYEAPNG